MRLGAYGEPIVVPDSVRHEWDLETAVIETRPGNLFPSRIGWSAAYLQTSRLGEVLNGTAAMGLRPTPVEIVRVPKGDRATRPAANLAVEDEVLLAALTRLIRTLMPEGFVSFTGEGSSTYGAFERFALEEGNVPATCWRRTLRASTRTSVMSVLFTRSSD